MSESFIADLLKNAETSPREEVEEMLSPVGGDMIVRNMKDEEIESYILLANVEIELGSLQDHLIRRHLAASVDKFLNDDELTGIDLNHMIQLGMEHKFFENDQEAHDFFQRVTTWEYTQAKFWFDMRTLTGNFTDRLEVRANWKIVSTGKKYR